MVVLVMLLGAFPVVIFLSLFFEGIDRKLYARMQKRIGPPIIQPFYDFVKLLNKESIFPVTASKTIFTSVPIIAASSSILAAAIPLVSLATGAGVLGDLILISYLLAMSSILVMIGGSSSGNPYGAIGFSRKVVMLIGYEVPLLTSILALSLKSKFSFSYIDVVMTQVEIGTCFALASPGAAMAAIAFLLCMPAATGVVPFDIPEAKTEIIHGYLVEYSGPYLAFARLAKDATSFALSFLAFTLFFYHPPLLEDFALMGKLISIILIFIFTFIVMFFTITIPRTIFARLKIGQAFKFYWRCPLVLSVLAVIFVNVGL
jgi:formate hydrogenlyase subunit 4